MWIHALLLRTQAAAEYVAVGSGMRGAGELFRQAVYVIRQNPVETVGVIGGLVLLFVVVLRFNEL
jgi:hypothetical protein